MIAHQFVKYKMTKFTLNLLKRALKLCRTKSCFKAAESTLSVYDKDTFTILFETNRFIVYQIQVNDWVYQ